MTLVRKPVIHGEINGFCDPRFERVATAFEQNFRGFATIHLRVEKSDE